MAETSMSVDSLDASLLYLKIGDHTLENLASSLIKSTESDGDGCCAEFDDSGCGRSAGGAPNTPLDLSRKSSPNHETEGDLHQHTFKNMRPENNNSNNSSNNNNKTNISDNNNNITNKMWSASMQDLNHTVERILAAGGGVSEDWRTPDLSYMGVPPSLGEMLLQHGEFPATPAFTPMPRYRSTPLETNAGIYGDSSSMGSRHNDAFAASITSSLGHQQHPFAQGMGELTYGMCGGGDKKWGPFSRSLLMTTPENLFVDNTPRFSLGQHQASPASMHSGMSWRVGDGEAAWTSLSSCYSLSSRGSGASFSGKHYTSPVEGSSSCSHPQFSDPQYKTVRSAPPYGRYHEWSDVRSSRLPHSSTTSTTAAHHYPYAFSHVPHHQHVSRCMPGTGEEMAGGGAPEKVSPRKALIHDVVLRESIRAFRSHPLFPLLKDLAVADYYFEKASFSVAPLLSFLPMSTEELVSVYRRRNPEVGHATTFNTPAVNAVIMDAIVYAHTSLLGKVTSHAATMTASVESEVAEMDALVDEMCQKYMGVVRSSTPLHILQALGTEFPDLLEVDGNDKDMDNVKDPLHQMENLMAPFSPIPPSLDASRASLDSTAGAPDSHKRGRFHRREVVEVLTAWLTEHREHPYPDDDDKVFLMQRTGLTAQQITQWFTNARRRILPRLKADVAKEERDWN